MARQADAEEGMGPMERGGLRYRQKDYNGALKAFNEVRGAGRNRVLLTMYGCLSKKGMHGLISFYVFIMLFGNSI